MKIQMNIFRKEVWLILLMGSFHIAAYAQGLSDVPTNLPNTRFNSTDVFNQDIVRPALSIRGFDSSILPGGNDLGYGMKQILELYLAANPDISNLVDSYIIPQSQESLVVPSGSVTDKTKIIHSNSRITQSRAFLALATYILERNGYNASQILGRSHSVALTDFRSAVNNPANDDLTLVDIVTDESDNIQDVLSLRLKNASTESLQLA